MGGVRLIYRTAGVAGKIQRRKSATQTKCVVKLLTADDLERLEQCDRERAAKMLELEKAIREGKA